jgi:chemotaxis protein histidine kinase CheA/ActR/RegA family two-component response regulator
MSNAFDKLSVLESFIEEVNSYLPEIETNLGRLAQSPDDIDALEETYRRTHTIGGSASMMDFPGLAHVAHGMEDILGDVLDGVATLDSPTIGLLQRSLGRMQYLLQGIHDGVNEQAVIAEDDADYTQYRMMIESSTQLEQTQITDHQQSDITQQLSAEPSIPSIDEMLASFRTPTVEAGAEIDWPEEPVSVSHLAEYNEQRTPSEAFTPPIPPQHSALEVLAASSNQPSNATTAPLPPTDSPEVKAEPVPASQPQNVSTGRQPELLPSNAHPANVSFARAYAQMQEETRVLETQATTFKSLLTQLRSTVSVIETQRAEFRSFLDGSKDALDRMEDWAGHAMGLNLRNSPEQVRRYLPLSVMWVANSKLKKVLELLTQMVNGVETTDEQVQTALQQLQTSVESCGAAFQQLRADTPTHVLTQDPGWTPWEMLTPRDTGQVQERVTFERRGDLQSLHAELEAQIREELRHEYESRPSTLAARAELERQIRKEVLQELEASRQLQERLVGAESGETLQEIEARIRNEMEIQVRREFLNNLTDRLIDAQSGNPSSLTPADLSVLQSASTALQREPAVGGQAIPVPTQTEQPASSTPPVPTQSVPQPAPAVNSTSSPVSFGSDFGEEATEIFRLEAEEHLQTISMRVAALEKSPDDLDLIQGIRRATHTLKGAAGMMGFRTIADLCHVSEDLLDSVMEGKTAISPPVLSIILDTAEVLDMLINSRENEQANAETMAQALRARYVALLGEVSSRNEEDLDAEEDPLLESSPVSGVLAGSSPDSQALASLRADLSVRVRLEKLDELVNLFGEVLVNRNILEERIERLIRLVADVGISSNRLRDVGQKLESRFEAATLPSGRSLQAAPRNGNQNSVYTLTGYRGGNSRDLVEAPHTSEFDELELDRYTEFHQLTRGLSEGISDMTTLSSEMEAIIRECESVFARESRLNTTFQDRLLKARLVPLSMMTPRLYRTARSVALKQHKEFEFLLEGESTEIDRNVSEEIAGPLLHLVRNAVNHGLETPEVREQKGKSPVGQIKLSASYEGNLVVITVRDDGAGIDPERVRNEAINRGLIRPGQVLTDNDVFSLIFQPGFSTAEVLSEESGRGVGLDVVRDSVARLKGTLEIEFMPGQGTAFTMKFPTSLAIQNATIVRVGTQQFAIPMVVIESIGRMDHFKRSTLNGKPAIAVRNELYPLHMLSQYLGLPVGTMDEKAPLLLVNAGGHKVALVIDEITGKMDVVMKSLGPHLRHVHGVAGGTILGNGRVVLILELSELLTIRPADRRGVTVFALNRDDLKPRRGIPPPDTKRNVTLFTPPPAPKNVTKRGNHLLIVDDSPSVRRVVGNMLKQHGWQVQSARDGVEALEMITNETPAAVLLDIEMPRMDGYELMATVRAQEQYRTLPLVILTSRAAAKHRQRAMQLGASAYVVKPYQDEDLLNTLNSLVYGATAP